MVLVALSVRGSDTEKDVRWCLTGEHKPWKTEMTLGTNAMLAVNADPPSGGNLISLGTRGVSAERGLLLENPSSTVITWLCIKAFMWERSHLSSRSVWESLQITLNTGILRCSLCFQEAWKAHVGDAGCGVCVLESPQPPFFLSSSPQDSYSFQM